VNILIGNRNARQYIEPQDHRRGYSIRPAYRPEPSQGERKRIVEGVVVWVVAPLVAWGFVAWFVHSLLPSVR
jgi:hypothetical protein